MKTCCEYHGFEEDGCNGRNCPAGRIELPPGWFWPAAIAASLAIWALLIWGGMKALS